MLFLDLLTILCAGLMIGSELAVSLRQPCHLAIGGSLAGQSSKPVCRHSGQGYAFLVRIVSRSHGCRGISSPSSASTDLASHRGGHLDCDHRLYRHHPGAHQQSHCPPGRCFARGMAGRAQKVGHVSPLANTGAHDCDGLPCLGDSPAMLNLVHPWGLLKGSTDVILKR
jgi:hypothetical protein